MSPVTLDPKNLSSGNIYDLMASLIVPRPIAFVSTLSASGIPNLAPFSFFSMGGVNPPSVVFSPGFRFDGTPKDSLQNITVTGEFVISMVTREMAEGMNATAAGLPSDESEWDLAGFTPVSSEAVKPARVLESPASVECKLFEIVRHGEQSVYVIGEIVRFHVDGNLLRDNSVESLKPISRMGGSFYADLDAMELFTMERPR